MQQPHLACRPDCDDNLSGTVILVARISGLKNGVQVQVLEEVRLGLHLEAVCLI